MRPTASESACATTTDGSMWCWGDNTYGQLGVGDLAMRTVPTRVGAATDWHSTAPSWDHTCALEGAAYQLSCWGRNLGGQLGVGDMVDRTTPTAVSPGTSWVEVHGGSEYTCALRSDDTLWCWGLNTSGEVGVGDTVQRATPTRVP